jgi:hypothetical protein
VSKKPKKPLDRALCLRVIRALCVKQTSFISEEIWMILGARARGCELRHLGLVMLKAQRRGWCVRTDQYHVIPRCHNLIRPVWRSLICKHSRKAAA